MNKPTPLDTLLDKAVQDALGAAHLEIAKLRAMNAAQGGEINRLRDALRTASEPRLPLEDDKREVSNGHAH